MGLKYFKKWHRAAIVTNSWPIRILTGTFSFLMPGEFKGFRYSEMKKAIDWVSEAEKK